MSICAARPRAVGDPHSLTIPRDVGAAGCIDEGGSGRQSSARSLLAPNLSLYCRVSSAALAKMSWALG
jgi:hypothetical protein